MKKNWGMSILEVVITTAIILILAAGFFRLLLGGRMFYGVSEAKMTAQEHARLALARIEQELRAATSSCTYIRNEPPSSGQITYVSIPVSGTNPTVYSGNQILFQLPCRYSPSGAIALSATTGEVIFGAPDAEGNWCSPISKVWNTDYWIEYYAEPQTHQLKRRVWDMQGADFTQPYANPIAKWATSRVDEKLLSVYIESLGFRSFTQSFPYQVEIIVAGRGRVAERQGEELTAFARTELFLRNNK